MLDRAGKTVLLLIVGMLRESRQALELRTSKGSRSSRLERTAKKQLGWQKRRELHIEGCTWGGHLVGIVRRLLVHRLSVDRRNVASSRVSIGEACDVRGEGTMGEARIAVGGLRRVTEAVDRAAAGGALADWTVEVLHPEQMRGDERVPPNVR